MSNSDENLEALKKTRERQKAEELKPAVRVKPSGPQGKPRTFYLMPEDEDRLAELVYLIQRTRKLKVSESALVRALVQSAELDDKLVEQIRKKR